MGWNDISDPDMRTANFEFSCDVYREGVYWYHACDETLDGQAAQLAAYFCRLHCVFHLTVHVGSILIFLNVVYAMHYDVFTWMPIQNNKGPFT